MRLQVERTTASPPTASSLGERAARVEVERDPLAQLDRSAVVRDADEREHRHDQVGQREDDGDEREAGELEQAARRPRQPWAKDEQRA